MRVFLFSAGLSLLGHPALTGATPDVTPSEHEFKIPEHIGELFEFYCHECHESGMAKGSIRFDNLEDLSHGQRLDLMNNALEQVYSGEMPPKKADQPTEKEREDLSEWIWRELKIFNASKLEDKLRYYKYGNYVNHDKLFSGEIEAKPATPARRWRVNNLIYVERVNDVFELEGKSRQDKFFGLILPFNETQDPGVRYYDNEVVEGGQFLTLLSNAEWIVGKQLRDALIKSGQLTFPKEYQEAKKRGQRYFLSRYQDEAWNPRSTAKPLEAVIMHDGIPDDTMLQEAIAHQFKVTLQRQPTKAEEENYMGLLARTLETSGNTSALKAMMTGVLMEPEFLYRNEFGGGDRDQHGRVPLTPREAAYAISYALTDRIPDDALFSAARRGELKTKSDYEREVRRYLADGSIDKPRILRFFREYFGYDNIYNVFKDEDRFGGDYNPRRIISTHFAWKVPGKVADEADTLVEWVLQKDQDVLKTLLTTDRFFVHHSGDNKEMAKRAEQATFDYQVMYRELYERTKGMKNSDEITKEIREIYKEHPDWKIPYLNNSNLQDKSKKVNTFYFLRDMDNLGIIYARNPGGPESRDKVYLPNVRTPGHGASDPLSVSMYNLDMFEWSYEPEQPVRLENRIGMLTHPAWLVANSKNAATDPIHRGKWVREKLLGGFVRDVPITVDAKVPEDPDKTLRQKFAVSEAKNCWQCHEKMNPLGYVFESYDDFGRFRTEENIEYPENIVGHETVMRAFFNRYEEFQMPIYKTRKVDPSGYLEGTGDPSLDGPVEDVNDLMTRLAKSEKVRQVFVRHAFRYFMGRNETLADAETLIEADKAYVGSGGSFTELMVSLLTSDSFIYRN